VNLQNANESFATSDTSNYISNSKTLYTHNYTSKMESSGDSYNDLSWQYAEMLTLCQPFYALQQSPSSIGNSTSKQESFYIHPRLEDGLLSMTQRQQRGCAPLENLQDNTFEQPPLRAPSIAATFDFAASTLTTIHPVSCSSSSSDESRTSCSSLDGSLASCHSTRRQ
jgi:hypothetical protein